MIEEIVMPIIMSHHEKIYLNGLPEKVTIPRNCEEQAISNHRQTLDELKANGGIGWDELFAILKFKSRPFRLKVWELVDLCREYHFI